MKTLEEIAALYEEAKRSAGPVRARQRQLRDAYNGDIALPLPELDRSEMPAVVNLFQQGVDALGQRGSSVMPDLHFAPQRPGMKKWEDISRTQRQVGLAWWKHNRLQRQMGRRFRWYFAYGSAPVRMRYDFRRQIPVWRPMDPLTCFMAPTQDPDDIEPEWGIHTYRQSLGWLKSNYPQAFMALRKPMGHKLADFIEILEYHDAEEVVLVVQSTMPYGTDNFEDRFPQTNGADKRVQLERHENATGKCLIVAPGRITLDRAGGQFDGMIGPYITQAMLTALEIIAVKKGIFADQWLVARPNEQPVIVSPADGVRGEIGVVTGGDIRDVQTNPGFQTNPTIDRLERAQRVTGGVPAELGGEAGSNIRTGRRGAQLLSAVIDFPVQEAQQAFEVSMEAEMCRAIALDKTVGSRAAKTIYVSWKGARGRVDYTASDLWQTDYSTVSYAFAGADTNGLVIEGGQRIGMGTMSKRQFMSIDPLIEDVEVSMDQITVEGLELAFMSSIQAQAADPAGPYQPGDLARIVQLVKMDKLELFEAVQKVQEEAQERQAQQVPAGDPAAQPGLAPPGMGAEAPAAIGEPEPSMGNLTNILGNLRLQQRQTPNETAPPMVA